MEPFTTDVNGNTVSTLTYDANGNLIYDGVQYYTYDAWNRQVAVAHGYSTTTDGVTYTPHAGQVFSVMGTFDSSHHPVANAPIWTSPRILVPQAGRRGQLHRPGKPRF